MSPARYADMEAVRVQLLDEYREFFLPNLRYAPSDASYFNLLERRFNNERKPPLRAYYVVLLRRYIENEIKQKIKLDTITKGIVLPFVSEILMAIMYYDNQIFDRKAGVIKHSKQNHNILQSNILQAELYNYIETRVNNIEVRHRLLTLVRNVYEIVNIGQEIEQQCCRYQNWYKNEVLAINYRNLPIEKWVISEALKIIKNVADLPGPRLQLIEKYLERIYLVNAYFFVYFTEFLLDFSNGNHLKKSLKRFAGFVGMIFQIVNDVCDFVPSEMNPGTHTKEPFDALSDLKNRNITLPIMIHLVRFPDGKIAGYLRSKKQRLLQREEMEMVIEMLHSKAIDDTQKIAVELERKTLMMLNHHNTYYSIVKDMLNVVHRNRYYILLNNIL